MLWSYSDWDGTVNSPHLRKPKNARAHAAQNNMLTSLVESFCKTSLIFAITSMVIGSRTRGGLFFAACFLMPVNTISNFGVNSLENSSCKPAVICRLRTADRYPLMDWWAKPSSFLSHRPVYSRHLSLPSSWNWQWAATQTGHY